QPGTTDFHPRRSALAVRVDGFLLVRPHLDLMSQLIADLAGQRDRTLTDVDLRRRRQTERLEELLHGGETARVGSFDGVGPAIVLAPAAPPATLKEQGSFLG